MASDIILLKTFRTPLEAEIAKGRLEASGILAFLSDGNVVPHLPFFEPKDGVRLFVLEKDKKLALELLAQEE